MKKSKKVYMHLIEDGWREYVGRVLFPMPFQVFTNNEITDKDKNFILETIFKNENFIVLFSKTPLPENRKYEIMMNLRTEICGNKMGKIERKK